MSEQKNGLNIVGPKNTFPRVTLVEPTQSGYLIFALEVDHRPPFGFFIESKRKREIIKKLKDDTIQLQNDPGVSEATVFKTLIHPPGKSAFLKERPGVYIAKFDVVLLVEFVSPVATARFLSGSQWKNMEESYSEQTEKSLAITGTNIRCIGPVDHSRDGVFLFNYFYADDSEQNIKVWDYTAGWFQYQTGLDNSTVILPDVIDENSYKLINHCRWDHLRELLPSLLFKPTFKTFVLNNFEANHVAAMPILYRLA